MRFSKNLYIKDIKWPRIACFKLAAGVGQIGFYVVAINNGKDQLDIYPVEILKQRSHRMRSLYVLGMVRSREQAYEYVGNMVELCIKTRGDCNIKEFIFSREPGARQYIGK